VSTITTSNQHYEVGDLFAGAAYVCIENDGLDFFTYKVFEKGEGMKTKIIFPVVLVAAFILSCSLLFAHEGHEHASNLPVNVRWGFEGVKELVNLHPLFTHFPIALLFSAFGFYLLGVIFRKDHFFKTGQWTLFFGTLGAGVAVWTGLQAANSVPHDETTHAIIMAHQYLGIAVLVLSALLSLWVLISKSNLPKVRVVFVGGLFLIVVLLLQQVDFGGRLVFFHGVGMGRKSVMNKEVSQSHHSHEHHGKEEAGDAEQD
jgi:uncharacterized membrane protein